MLIRCIKAENRKLRHASIWAVFFLLPLISAIYGTFNYRINIAILQNGWYSLWTQHTLFYALLFFAPMTAVCAAYLWRLEHLGNNWNTMMTAPVHPSMLFFAKYLTAAKAAFLTQGWVFVLYLFCGKIFCDLPDFPPLQTLWWMLRGFFGAVAVTTLQCLLSMMIRSFAVPVLIALAGGIVANAILSLRQGLFFPYALMILGMNSNRATDELEGGLVLFIVSCAVQTILFGMVANLILTKRDVKTAA